jgi:DNA-binding NarL/FixJ family response regulator
MISSPPSADGPGRLITVAIVHPDVLVSAGIRRILELRPDFRVVEDTAEVQRAVAVAAERRPRVMVMSLHSPGLPQAMHMLRRSGARTAVAIVADYTPDEDAALQALLAGVSAVLERPHHPEGLANALRVIADGRTVLLPAALLEALAGKARSAVRFDRESVALVDQLSPREYEVLGHLAYGLSNAEIAETLSVSEHTVKSHIKRVMSKLQCTNRCEAALVAYRSGVVR